MTEKENIVKATKETYQKILNLLDPESLKENLSETDINDRAHDADTFRRQWFGKFLDQITFEQVKQLGNNSTADVLVAFHNGVLYGYQVISDWFEKQRGICAKNNPTTEDLGTGTGISPVGGNPIKVE